MEFDSEKVLPPLATSTPVKVSSSVSPAPKNTPPPATEITAIRNLFQQLREGNTPVEEVEQKVLDMVREGSGHISTLKVRLDRTEHSLKAVGANAADVLLLKNTSKAAIDALQRILESDEFVVTRISDGKVISSSQLADVTMNGIRSPPSEEFDRVVSERDKLRIDAQRQHETYQKLFEAYNFQRNACDELRVQFDDAVDKLKEACKEIEEWELKYHTVRENAEAELERASFDYEKLMKNHEENTLGLRMKVKKYESDLKARTEEVASRDKRVKELSEIIDQLMHDVDISDSESQRMGSSYDH